MTIRRDTKSMCWGEFVNYLKHDIKAPKHLELLILCAELNGTYQGLESCPTAQMVLRHAMEYIKDTYVEKCEDEDEAPFWADVHRYTIVAAHYGDTKAIKDSDGKWVMYEDLK